MKNTSRGRPRPASRVQPSRRTAYNVLIAVDADDAYANLLLPHEIERASLNSQDAAFATELCYGALRRQGFYDAVIEAAAHRPVEAIDLTARNILRLGVHQLLSTRVAPHAAVNESVALAHDSASRSVAGFVNGVLRRVSQQDAASWIKQLSADSTDEAERLAIEHAHPAWVVRAFSKALEAEGRGDELELLLEADNRAPRVNYVTLDHDCEIPSDATPNRFSPRGFSTHAGDPEQVTAKSPGRRRVQDEGSQLAALALSRAMPVNASETWLDLCAGPGGKAALLAAEAERSGTTVWANEVSPSRTELVRRAVAAFEKTVTVTTEDGRTFGSEHPEQFDRVLVDAPCTGLGALRRRPEARWRRRPSDVSTLAEQQAELLRSAVRATRPGGIIAYVTCSPHLGETRAIVGPVLRSADVTAVDAPAVVRSISGDIDLGTPDPSLSPEIPSVQLWPHRHGTDAMYIALLRKQR